MMLSSVLQRSAGLAATVGLLACGAQSRGALEIQPMSEKVLAARKLQVPLGEHACKAAVYATAERSWRVTRVMTVAGRGKTFLEALEALCREADGVKAEAVADIYYWRMPSGWSDTHEVRGAALRYDEGFKPPTAPPFASVRPPQVPQASASEPPPSGESTP